MCVHAQLCLTLCNPWSVADLAPLSMGFSRQEYCSGLPFPPPGDLPRPRDQTGISCIEGGFFTAELSGKTQVACNAYKCLLRTNFVFWEVF